MKIERINDNQIRCTLTGEDLANRHLQLSELAYGSDKAKRLFRDMMQQASYELGFEANDIPLMIEAIPLSGGSIMLNVTKVEYPEELDSRFSNFTDFGDALENFDTDNENSPALEGADTILDLFRKLSAAASSLRDTDHSPDADNSASHQPAQDAVSVADSLQPEAPVEVAADMIKLFSFRNVDHLIRLAHVLDGFYTGDNSLFLDTPERVYYLVLHKGDHTPSEFNKVCNILSEYALQNRYVESAESYFGEHFKCITAHNALQRLSQL
ncbi:MAG: adaptor protein MecA [Lachnospiraceae bacterium]|nr:adaptor protein MecA [Lachnospiraceae bacterium]